MENELENQINTEAGATDAEVCQAETEKSSTEGEIIQAETEISPIEGEVSRIKKTSKKQVNILVLILSVLLAVLFTFEITFLVVDGINRNEKLKMAEEYNEQLENYKEQLEDKYGEMDVFASIIEMFNSLPEESRNIELYYKLAMIDYYYRNLYANEIDEDELIYYTLNGYVAGAGDRHGEYYTADDFKSITQENQGNTVGIGVYVNYSQEYNAIKILSVMEGSPAYKAGIKAGDVIVAIDGEKVSELGYYVALEKVKGEAGTDVKLTLVRDGAELDVIATRAKVETKTVYYHQYEYDKEIGVIRVIEFNNVVPKQFKEAVEALKEKGVKYLVFDMRNNPGGTLSSVVDILDYLLPEGDIAHVTDANGKIQKTYKSDASCLTGIDGMAVLVNENTASAAELFTSALMDYEKAIIVGENTYGKGSMQTIYMLPDGTGLRLTTNKYNPPKSENYDGTGIKPDIEIELSEALAGKSHFEYTDSEDNQLQKACEALKKDK